MFKIGTVFVIPKVNWGNPEICPNKSLYGIIIEIVPDADNKKYYIRWFYRINGVKTKDIFASSYYFEYSILNSLKSKYWKIEGFDKDKICKKVLKNA